uniref:Uncharacterized protein n=1 Tax=Opuntia streptacantha TaxID=393608 RepID=A0A7C8ZHB7_OPUST
MSFISSMSSSKDPCWSSSSVTCTSLASMSFAHSKSLCMPATVSPSSSRLMSSKVGGISFSSTWNGISSSTGSIVALGFIFKTAHQSFLPVPCIGYGVKHT